MNETFIIKKICYEIDDMLICTTGEETDIWECAKRITEMLKGYGLLGSDNK